MAFITFIGRVLFASVFILSAWQEFNGFGTDGGAAAKSLEPKFHIFSKHVLSHTGVKFPEVEIKLLVAAAIALKGVGGILFVFGSSLGAFLLLLHQAISIPILYDFYNYDVEKKEFNQLFLKFTQSLALFGALLFFIGMKNSTPRRQLRKKAPKTKTG
ncbi:HR-like lesion-inducing protein-related [Quillaja saponaria]|uniref:HR-like lesion-inducing protein-related n=1 Tax=Quillaja saponaria TaxID=32244 RepID=A0AAD7LBC8_QUISA|nr:HR-like lesion-inducing protein-related [Quillaja saponaria]